MKKYIKENSDSIIKLFVNHIGMAIFGLIVLITTMLMAKRTGNSVLFYVMGGLAILMYFSLIYTAMWERGARDKIRVDGGRMERNIWHGLYMYLIANAVAIISAVLVFAFSFFSGDITSVGYSLYTGVKLIASWWSGMYLTFTSISISSPTLHSLLYFAVIIPGAIVSCVSYILGLKGFKCLFPEPKRDQNRKLR